jgi:transposase
MVMDNCSFHHGNNVEPHLRDILEEKHAHLIYQPPYHPCYNTWEAQSYERTLHRYPKYTKKYTELCISDALGLINEGLSRQFFKFFGYIY